MAEITFLNRYFQKKKCADFVIQSIERNYFASSLVDRKHFCCLMKIFSKDNRGDGRNYFY